MSAQGTQARSTAKGGPASFPRTKVRYGALAVAHVMKGVVRALKQSYGPAQQEPLPDRFAPLIAQLLTGPLGRSVPGPNTTRPTLNLALIKNAGKLQAASTEG